MNRIGTKGGAETQKDGHALCFFIQYREGAFLKAGTGRGGANPCFLDLPVFFKA